MAPTYRVKAAVIHRNADLALRGMFDALITSVSRELRRQAVDGVVPIAKLYTLQQYAGEQVTGLFVTPYQNTRHPFTILQDGTPFPLSPFARILFQYAQELHQIVVEYHAKDMRRKLNKYPDLILRLQGQNVVQEINLGLRPNPFIDYEPMHTWVDPAGYQLSDRIWRTGGYTRRKLDMFLEDNIRQGFEVDDIIGDLEQFLQPGRELIRSRGYGTSGSFDARRLLQTELKRAESAAAETVARLNPFIETMSVVLSPSHPKYDICDVAAAASPFPKEEIPPTYRIPLHPFCLCHYEYGFYVEREVLIDELRSEARSGNLLTALMTSQILKWLLTGWLIKKRGEDRNEYPTIDA